MKRSTLLALAVFAALLVGAVVLLTQKPERGISRVSFADLQKDAIDRLVWSGKNAAEVKRQGTTWQLANGKQADNAALGRLLDALVKVTSSNLLTRDAARFGEYELDQEKGTKLEAYSGNKKVAELVVGKSLPGGVAMRIGDGAFAVSGTSAGVFVRPAGGWIEHRLFDDKLDNATRLEVKLANSPAYALIKKDNAWALEDPKVLPTDFRFDAEAARTLVSNLVSVRAKDFEEQDPGSATTGIDDTSDVLSVTFVAAAPPTPGATAGAAAPPAPGATPGAAVPPTPGAATDTGKPAPTADNTSAAPPVVRTLRLGRNKAESKDVYAKVDGRDDVFTLVEGTAKNLRKTATELRDLKLMKFDVAKAQMLMVNDGKVNLVFAKKDGAWSLVKSSEPKPQGFDFDPTTVERRVSAVLGARALRLADAKEGAQSGLTAPVATVTVELEGGTAAILRFGKDIRDAEREAVFAQGNIDGATYLVAKWTRQNLAGGIATFKKVAPPTGGGMPNLDAKALSNLPPDVRDSLLKQMAQKQREQQMQKQLEAQAPKAAPGAPAASAVKAK